MGSLELDCHSSVNWLWGTTAHSPLCVTQPFSELTCGSFITCSESNCVLVLSRKRNAILSIVCCRMEEISFTYGNCAGVNMLKVC